MEADRRWDGSGSRGAKEWALAWVFRICAAIPVLVTIALAFFLVTEALGFFSQVSVWEFLTSTRWTPLFQEKHFGILPLVWGSVLVATGAGILALPTALLAAIFLSDYAGPRVRGLVRPALDVMAGIPTVVYGYFALTLVTPVLRGVLPGTGVFNAASAMVAVGVMVLPTVVALSEDALRAVPASLREAAYGLGATKMEVTTRVVVPAGLSGILASFILGLSRALGETMVVSIAAGASPHLTLNPLEAIQTMTAYVVQAGLGGMARRTMEYRTLFVVGLTLLLITLGMNLLGQWVKARFRRAAP